MAEAQEDWTRSSKSVTFARRRLEWREQRGFLQDCCLVRPSSVKPLSMLWSTCSSNIFKIPRRGVYVLHAPRSPGCFPPMLEENIYVCVCVCGWSLLAGLLPTPLTLQWDMKRDRVLQRKYLCVDTLKHTLFLLLCYPPSAAHPSAAVSFLLCGGGAGIFQAREEKYCWY